jgi:hypothetical protein
MTKKFTPDELIFLKRLRLDRAEEWRKILHETPKKPIVGQGHGHVTPRADGVKARCGGPSLCNQCWAEQRALLSTFSEC